MTPADTLDQTAMNNPPLSGKVIEPQQGHDQPQTPSGCLRDGTEALASKESPITAQQEHAFQLKQEDLVPQQHVERHDTFESLRSSFGHRTNTGWSTAMSTTTDYTEPDLTTLHDEDEDEHAPPIRRFTLPCPSDDFQSLPPTRTSSFAHGDQESVKEPCSVDLLGDLPAPRHPSILRVQGLSSGSVRKRDATEPSSQGLGNLHHNLTSLADDVRVAEQSVGDFDRFESRLAGQEQLLHQVEPISERSEPPQPAVTHRSGYEDGLSQTSEESEADSFATQRPAGDLVHDFCVRVLRDTFGLDLQELASTDAASAAYEATRYFLDELSRIVPTAGLVSRAPLLSQSARDSGAYSQTFGPPPADSGSNSARGNGSGSKRSQNEEDDDSNQDGFDDGNGPGGNGKRPRTDGHPGQSDDQNLSCPFRKRNPVKFNVRDHQSCAVQSFPDISQLKRHVKIFHRQKLVSGFACPRCKHNTGSKESLEMHLAVSNDLICDFQTTPSSQNPEDGINGKIEDVLNGRRANTKVDTWEILWRTLFPCDEATDIPNSDFVPPIELEEVYAEFRAAAYQDDLRRRITEVELRNSGGPNAEARAAATVEICEQHIELIFDTCRRRKTGNLPSQKRRKRAQKQKATQGPAEHHLSIRPARNASQLGYGGGSAESSPSSSHDTGSAISGGSWAYPVHSAAGALGPISPGGPMRLPSSNFHELLTAESSNASVVLNTGDSSPGMVTTAFPAQDSPHRPPNDSPVSFEPTPLFSSGNIFHGRAPAFRDQRSFQMLNFADQPMTSSTNDRGSFQMSASMQSLADPAIVPTAIDTGFPFTTHMGHGGFNT